jgi:hypothetical protein
MNRIISMLLLIGMAGGLQAQVSVGVTAGLGLTGMSLREDGHKPEGVTYSPGLGFRLGGFGEYALPQNENLSFRAGLELGFTNFSEKYQGTAGASDKFSTSFTSLLVPVQARYAFPVGDKTLVFSAGPFLRANLGGKIKSAGDSQKLEFGKDGDYRAITAGLRLGLAYRFYLTPRRPSLHASFDAPAQTKPKERPIDFELMGQVLDGNMSSEYYAKQYKDKARLYAVMVSFHWTLSFYKNK